MVVDFGEVENRIHSHFYLRHLQSFIMRSCSGLTAQRRLGACEDYWQYAPTKQLKKANNCLKVNNNAMISWWVGMGWEGYYKPNRGYFSNLCFINEIRIWSLLLLVYIHDLYTEMQGRIGILHKEVLAGQCQYAYNMVLQAFSPEWVWILWMNPSLSMLLGLPISKCCLRQSPLRSLQRFKHICKWAFFSKLNKLRCGEPEVKHIRMAWLEYYLVVACSIAWG